jgi:phage terminase large subunit GpA-like protein
MTAVRKWIVETLSPAWKPIARMLFEEWAEKNIVLTPKESIDNPGPYQRHHAIYAPRFFDTFMDDPQWRSLAIMKSSQTGITLHALILVARTLAERMMNILYSVDSKNKARETSVSRLQPLLQNCRATKGQIAAAEDEVNNFVYNLPNGILRLIGSHSAGAFASDPYGLVLCDELDKHPKMDAKGEATTWELAGNRIKRSEEGRAIGWSTPTTEDGIINIEYLAGSQHGYFVPCPRCSHFQVLEIEGVRYSHCRLPGGDFDLEKVLQDTYYRCESCHGRIDEHEKESMFLAGEPRARNYREVIDPDGTRRQVPNWLPGQMSAHISDLYSLHPKSTWGHIAVKFILAQKDPRKLHDFNNGVLGKPLKQTVSGITAHHVLRLRGNYKRGTLPIVPAVALLAVDNQDGLQKWMKGAFMPNGDCYVIDWGKTLALEESEDLANAPIPTPAHSIICQRAIIDEGGKGGTSYAVRTYCYPRFPRFFPAKGRGAGQAKNTIVFSDSALSRGGIETIPVCHFDDPSFKSLLYIERIKKFDQEKCENYGHPRLWFPSDTTEDLVKELTSEQLVRVLDANGVPDNVWKATGPNDWGDTLKMLYVLWNIIGANFVGGGK